MERAVKLAEACSDEPGRAGPAPRVGAVLARPDQILGEAYRGESGPGVHAEYALLSRLTGVELTGSTLYTTLEPCSARPTKKPCAIHVIERRVPTVFIGTYDTNPTIYRAGWKLMDEAGITLRNFPSDLRAVIRRQNIEFLTGFVAGQGDTGSRRFDYTLNGSKFQVITDTAGTFDTRWSSASNVAVYLYNGDPRYRVAEARFATAFDKIDDPGALDFENDSASLHEGEIGVVRNAHGYLLIRVVDVFNRRYGDDRYELSIEWESRPVL